MTSQYWVMTASTPGSKGKLNASIMLNQPAACDSQSSPQRLSRTWTSSGTTSHPDAATNALGQRAPQDHLTADHRLLNVVTRRVGRGAS